MKLDIKKFLLTGTAIVGISMYAQSAQAVTITPTDDTTIAAGAQDGTAAATPTADDTNGANGGDSVIFGDSDIAIINNGTVRGADGAVGGDDVLGDGGSAGGHGGMGVNFNNQDGTSTDFATLTNNASITGGNGANGSDATANDEDGGNGGDGGSGVETSADYSVIVNASGHTITGGNGGEGGAGDGTGNFGDGGDGGDGVVIFGGNNITLNNAGTITGGMAGTGDSDGRDGVGVFLAGINNTLINSGLITVNALNTYSTAALELVGDNLTITNSGTINGVNNNAISVAGASFNSFNNTGGTITSAGATSATVLVESDVVDGWTITGGTIRNTSGNNTSNVFEFTDNQSGVLTLNGVTVRNDGAGMANSGSGVAFDLDAYDAAITLGTNTNVYGQIISAAGGQLTLINNGTITGAITTNDQADNVTTSGNITGAINLGAGANIYTQTNGVVTSLTTGANGDDVNISGGSIGAIAVGDGTNTVDITGTGTAASVTGGAGTDTVSLDGTGTVTGNIALLGGTNNLYLDGTHTLAGQVTAVGGTTYIGLGTDANVTFTAAQASGNNISDLAVTNSATLNLSADFVADTIDVDGTLNIDTTDNTVLFDAEAGALDLDGTVNVTGAENAEFAADDFLEVDGTLSSILSGASRTLTLTSDNNDLRIGTTLDTTITAGNQIVLNSTNTTIGGNGINNTLLIERTADFDPTGSGAANAVIDATAGDIDFTGTTTLTVGVSENSAALADGDNLFIINGSSAVEQNNVDVVGGYATLVDDGVILFQDTALMDLEFNATDSDDEDLFATVSFNQVEDVFAAGSTGMGAAEALMDFPGATDELGDARLNLLNAATDEEAQAVGESLAPTVDAGVSGATMAMTDTSLGMTTTRLDSLRRGTETGVSSGSLSRGVQVWGQVFGQSADQSNRDGVAGYNADTTGVTVGFDTDNISDRSVIGVALTYARSDVDSDNVNSTQTDIDSYQLALYGDYDLGSRTYLSGLAAYSWNNVDSTRHDVGGTPGLNANGDFDADQYTVRAELGRDFTAGKAIITPNALVNWVHYSPDSYTETGAGTANLTVDGDALDVVQLGVGAKAEWDLKQADGSVFLPNVHAGYRYDVIGDKVQTTSSYTGGGAAFETEGFDPARSSVNVGTGLKFQTTTNWEFSANYDFEYKADYDAHAGYVRAGYKF